MIDAHLATLAWWAAVAVASGFVVFIGGMVFATRREQERQEWIARRRQREMRR